MTIVAAAFALNPQLDPDRLARDFARDGRVQVPGFLEDRAARALHAMLHKRTDWVQVLNVRDTVYDIPRETRADETCAEIDGKPRPRHESREQHSLPARTCEPSASA